MEIKNELMKLDHDQYGLDSKQAEGIIKSFVPVFEKMWEYEEEFKKIIEKKQSKTLAKEAKTLRNKFVKIRTATASVHKSEKSYFLKAGRFVDEIKNRQLDLTKPVEEKLASIENFEKIKERERIERLQESREKEIIDYIEPGALISNLGEMELGIWEAFKNGIISQFEKRELERKKAEEDRIERERLEAVLKERENLMRPYWRFVKVDAEDFETMSEKTFEKYLTGLKQEKAEFDENMAKQLADQEAFRKKQLEIEREMLKEKARLEAEQSALQKELLEAKRKLEQEIEAKRLKEEEAKRQIEAKIEAERIERKKEEEAKQVADSGVSEYDIIIEMMVDIQNRVLSANLKSEKYREAQKGVYNLLVNTTGIIKDKFKNG